MNDTNLLDFIHDLVERLMLRPTCDVDALQALIGEVRGELADMAADYEVPAPAGAEAVGELMKDCLALYDAALNHIARWIVDPDDERLRAAVQQAEEANDVLGAVEDLIQTNKNLISEMIEA